jgi:hypothetical protein
MMIEHHDDLVMIENLLTAHPTKQIGGTRRPAIVEHHVVRDHVDDFADFDGFLARVPGNDF